MELRTCGDASSRRQMGLERLSTSEGHFKENCVGLHDLDYIRSMESRYSAAVSIWSDVRINRTTSRQKYVLGSWKQLGSGGMNAYHEMLTMKCALTELELHNVQIKLHRPSSSLTFILFYFPVRELY